MVDININTTGVTLSQEESRRRLFEKQKAMLDLFLEKGAISRAQHDKSLGDLREKMHIG